MEFLSTSHAHTSYVDGKHTVEEMIFYAKQFHFVSLGLSEHAPQGFDPAYCMQNESINEYIDKIRAYQQTEKSIRVWCGLEIDSLVTNDDFQDQIKKVDYFISSTHYLPHPNGEAPIAIDGNPERLRAYIDQYLAGDGIAMAKAYYDLHVETLLRRQPAVIGHFDILRKYAASHQLFDENSASYRKVALNALERAFPCGGLLEINTGAIARGTMKLPYPTIELLGAWHEMGGQITLNSDCHNGPDLMCFYGEALKMIKEAGYRTIKHLGTADQLWEDWEL